MKKLIFPVLAVFLFSADLYCQEVVEEIYAIVNDEIVTYSELQNAERALLAMLQSRQDNQDQAETFRRMKKELLDNLIEQKMILSKARSRNYSVNEEVDMMIQEIMKENNIASMEDLRAILQNEGIEFSRWRDQLRLQRMQQRLIFEEVSSKIKVDNSEIMEYYRANEASFTRPAEFSLNCIMLKADSRTADELAEKTASISTELERGGDFVALATEYSELEGEENNYFLGRFKKGEMLDAIELEVKSLKVGEVSGWIKTGPAWYLVQLVDYREPGLIEYREVRDEISEKIASAREEVKFREYMETLKKESYIKILKNYE